MKADSQQNTHENPFTVGGAISRINKDLDHLVLVTQYRHRPEVISTTQHQDQQATTLLYALPSSEEVTPVLLLAQVFRGQDHTGDS